MENAIRNPPMAHWPTVVLPAVLDQERRQECPCRLAHQSAKNSGLLMALGIASMPIEVENTCKWLAQNGPTEIREILEQQPGRVYRRPVPPAAGAQRTRSSALAGVAHDLTISAKNGSIRA
jgi:hypothetical protein